MVAGCRECLRFRWISDLKEAAMMATPPPGVGEYAGFVEARYGGY
jgi:hypothetical protein